MEERRFFIPYGADVQPKAYSPIEHLQSRLRSNRLRITKNNTKCVNKLLKYSISSLDITLLTIYTIVH